MKRPDVADVGLEGGRVVPMPPPKARTSNGERAPADAIVTEPITDLGLAHRLVAAHGEDLRSVRSLSRWLVWDSARWCLDDTGEALRLCAATARCLTVEAAQAGNDTLLKAARRQEAQPRVTGALALAAVHERVVVRVENLDADPWLLNCANGTIDLRTCESLTHYRNTIEYLLCG